MGAAAHCRFAVSLATPCSRLGIWVRWTNWRGRVNYCLSLIRPLETDVIPCLGDDRVPDNLITQLAKVLQDELDDLIFVLLLGRWEALRGGTKSRMALEQRWKRSLRRNDAPACKNATATVVSYLTFTG